MLLYAALIPFKNIYSESVTQVASKHEALSSNLTPPTPPKKRQKRMTFSLHRECPIGNFWRDFFLNIY
jgi:hypothetical protein